MAFVSLVSFVAPVGAQKMTGSPSAAGYKLEPGSPSSTLPKPLREIGFDQNLDQHIPLDVPFTDDAGRAVQLRQYFGTRPVVMVFAYYECPMLCSLVENGLAGALKVNSLAPGRDFDVVFVSIDPRDTPQAAAAKKATFVERYGHPNAAAGAHFLTGEQASIQRLAKAAGFRYVWDEDTKQFAHPSGIIVLTPDGRLARYLFGIEYGPRDLRFGIVDASEGKVGSPADALLLYCFHYDPMTGKYGFAIMRSLRLAGIATVLTLGAFITVMVRREKGTRHPAPAPAPSAPSTQHPARGTR